MNRVARHWLVLLSILLLGLETAEAFDVKGLAPLQPFGVFSTFSAETLKQNQVGLSLGFERANDPNFYRLNFQMCYGITDRLEFEAGLPYVKGWGDGVDGIEDLNIGLKWRFLDEGTYYPSLAVLLFASAPTGRDEFTTDGGVGGGLIATKKLGPFKGHLNFFYAKPGNGELKREYRLDMGGEIAISNRSSIIGEIVGRKNYFVNKLDLVEWRLGYRIATTENIYTTIGAGYNIQNRASQSRIMIDVTFILPFETKNPQKIYLE